MFLNFVSLIHSSFYIPLHVLLSFFSIYVFEFQWQRCSDSGVCSTCVYGSRGLQKSAILREGNNVPAIVLHSERVDWTVADYKSIHALYSDVRRVIAMVFNALDAIRKDWLFDKIENDIEGCNLLWNLIQSCCQKYMHHFSLLDMPLTCPENERSCVLWSVLPLISKFGIKRPVELIACCLYRLYSHYYSICDPDSWPRDLPLELRHLRKPTYCLLRCHNTEVITLARQKRRSSDAYTLVVCRSYERICTSGMKTSPLFAFRSSLFVDSTKAQDVVHGERNKSKNLHRVVSLLLKWESIGLWLSTLIDLALKSVRT